MIRPLRQEPTGDDPGSRCGIFGASTETPPQPAPWASGLPETVWFESCGHGGLGDRVQQPFGCRRAIGRFARGRSIGAGWRWPVSHWQRPTTAAAGCPKAGRAWLARLSVRMPDGKPCKNPSGRPCGIGGDRAGSRSCRHTLGADPRLKSRAPVVPLPMSVGSAALAARAFSLGKCDPRERRSPAVNAVGKTKR